VIHTGWNSNDPEVARYNDPKHIIRIAEIFAQLKIVISRYFWPKVEYCYNLTKSLGNIYFDTSGLADDEVIKKTGLEKIVKVLTETTNERPDSLLFGTDYANCDIKKHINLIRSLKISNDDREEIFYGNANKIFRLIV